MSDPLDIEAVVLTYYLEGKMNVHDPLREDLVTGNRQWRAVTAGTYRKMLKCGKPIRTSNSSFLGCHATAAVRDGTNFYFTGISHGGGYFAALCSTGEWDTQIIGWGKPFPEKIEILVLHLQSTR
jgi:hypothetical protein